MAHSTFARTLTAREVADLLATPEVGERVDALVGPGVTVRCLERGANVFAVTGSAGEFVLRFPRDDADLARLRHEERVQGGLRSVTRLRVPDTRVVEAWESHPAFAVHRLVPGDELTGQCYASLSPEARSRLVADLVHFLLATHNVPPSVVCEWLGLPYEGDRTRERWALEAGKPDWFGPDQVHEIRRRLEPSADADVRTMLGETARAFEALEVRPEYMVFGHGDLHGGNVAVQADAVGPRLTGVFDLGNAGVLDVHYDYCRLNLIDDDLQDRVVTAYQASPRRACSLDVRRIEVYSRAFLLYLLAEQVDEAGATRPRRLGAYRKLVAMLRRYVSRYDSSGRA